LLSYLRHLFIYCYMHRSQLIPVCHPTAHPSLMLCSCLVRSVQWGLPILRVLIRSLHLLTTQLSTFSYADYRRLDRCRVTTCILWDGGSMLLRYVGTSLQNCMVSHPIIIILRQHPCKLRWYFKSTNSRLLSAFLNKSHTV
jgi:hypothetical protein